MILQSSGVHQQNFTQNFRLWVMFVQGSVGICNLGFQVQLWHIYSSQMSDARWWANVKIHLVMEQRLRWLFALQLPGIQERLRVLFGVMGTQQFITFNRARNSCIRCSCVCWHVWQYSCSFRLANMVGNCQMWYIFCIRVACSNAV